MDSSQKRERDRRKRQKRQDKAIRRKERAENKALRKAGGGLPDSSTELDASAFTESVLPVVPAGVTP